MLDFPLFKVVIYSDSYPSIKDTYRYFILAHHAFSKYSIYMIRMSRRWNKYTILYVRFPFGNP